jgi:uncharacterized protein YndB with AHSA1/START domain
VTDTTLAAREITIARLYDAPRELVWRAWTEPDRLARWWGKRGWTARLETIVIDLRVGGAFRVTTVSDEDGGEMTSDGIYREIVAPERLVFANEASLSVVTFTELRSGRTEMIFQTTLHATEALAERAAAGLGSAFDRLAEQFQHPLTKEHRMTVTGVDFVTVFVTDYASAKEFYGTILGLENSVDYGRIPAGEFETGSLTLQVMDAASIGREFAPSTHPIAFHVDDVEAARADLESKGVKFFGDTIDSGVCHMAHFADPDGNVLMFHNRYAPREA